MRQKKTAIKPNSINVPNLKKAAIARLDRITATQSFNRNIAKRGRYACTSTKTGKSPKWRRGCSRRLFGHVRL